jgi:hypothetical protein
MARGDYTKGATQQVFRTDASGFPLSSIERDGDGQLWHVVQGSAPTKVRDDEEVRAIAAEETNKGDDRSPEHGGGGGS